jgi:hypothetical protein
MLLSSNFARPSRHFVGEPVELPDGGDDGETMVLGFSERCWPMARPTARLRPPEMR